MYGQNQEPKCEYNFIASDPHSMGKPLDFAKADRMEDRPAGSEAMLLDPPHLGAQGTC